MARSGMRDGRYAWQLVAVVAFVATAAVAVVVARPRPIPAALAYGETVCTAASLRAQVGPATMPRTSVPWIVDYTLEFTNVSRQTCVLDGYPVVEAYTGARPVGSPAAKDTTVRPKTVTLVPGATAYTLLRYTATDWFGSAACHEVTVPDLRVSLRHVLRPMVVRWRNPACSRPGLSFLSVQAIQPRTGEYRSPHA